MIEGVFAAAPDWSEPVRERPSYLTDILRSHSDSEQRIQLRERPRTLVSYRVLTEGRESAALAAQIWNQQGKLLGVPFWPDAQPLLVSAAATDTEIEVETTYRRFAEGELVLLWRDQFTFEYAEIVTVNPTSVVLAEGLTGNWDADGRTWVVPLLQGRLRDSISLGSPASKVAELAVTFDCESVEPGAGTPGAGVPAEEREPQPACDPPTPPGEVRQYAFGANLFFDVDVTLLEDVVEGNVILAFYRGDPNETTISDSRGNTWIELFDIAYSGGGITNAEFRGWYCVANSSGPMTVHFDRGGYVFTHISAHVYELDAGGIPTNTLTDVGSGTLVALDDGIEEFELTFGTDNDWQAAMVVFPDLHLVFVNVINGGNWNSTIYPDPELWVTNKPGTWSATFYR